jgi:hypothetical protein
MILFTPFNAVLLVVNVLLAWLYLRPGLIKPGRCKSELEPLKPQEWTLAELRQYDGVRTARILIAIDWRVFDVSSERYYYGPGTLSLMRSRNNQTT